jgi:hypothetical protein
VSAGRRPWLRRAGRLELGGGETILWSVAEGRRGRRWRSARRDAGGGLLADLLLEVDPAGRWTRLELVTGRGILTLHPDPEGTRAHGNVVTGEGMRHLAFPWSAAHALLVEDEPVAACALGIAAGEPAAGPALVVRRGLEVAPSASSRRPARPPGGLPGPSWPLEDDAETAAGTPEG